MKTSNVAGYLVVYGFTHALVDASCILLILGGIDVREELLSYLILYNILAFGLQLPFGWIIDRIQKPVLSAVLGCVILPVALLLFMQPIAATLLAGIGNALFHVGGGTVSLNLRPGKASMPGVFVAPGGIGLVAGGLIAKFTGFHPHFFIILLLCMGVIIILLKSPVILFNKTKTNKTNYLVLIIVFILFTICIRSVVGLSVIFPWKSNLGLLLILTVSIALGKGLGGFLADFFGWIKIAVGGLAISSLLLFYGSQFPLIGIAGMFLFNLTMPVTLVAISNLLPGRPGFSFGLTTFAILLGAIPTFFSYKLFFSDNLVILLMVLFSAISLLVGLKFYFKKNNDPDFKNELGI